MTYRSVQELQRAIAVVQSSLNQQSGKRVRQNRLSGSKGLNECRRYVSVGSRSQTNLTSNFFAFRLTAERQTCSRNGQYPREELSGGLTPTC
jgi:hypothetical protein